MRRMGALAALLLLNWALPRPAAAITSTDTLVLCDDATDPLTLDPHRILDNKLDDILFQIFEGLYRLGPGGVLEPALATGCRWTDPLALRCDLRRGVVFHNGDAFDAQAVKWSILRALDPKTGFPAANEFDSIDSIETPDDHTVEIRTKRPDGLLLRRLAGYIKIASPKYFFESGPERFAAFPIGTGPFRFVRWDRGRALSLAANRDYWDKGRPRIRNVIFRFVPEKDQIPLLLSGELDAITAVPPMKALDIAADSRTKIVKQSVFATPAFWITSFTGPLKDRRVRQALNMAVDKDLLIRYASRGNGRALATLSMPGEPGHNESLRPYRYSEKDARNLLAEAGYSQGFSLSVLSSPQAEREARIISADWEKIGIKTKLTILPLSGIGAALAAPKASGFAYDVVANLAPDLLSHAFFLAGLCFHSASPFSRLNDPRFDALYAEVSSEIETTAQTASAQRLDALVYREAWGIFTYQKTQIDAMNAKLDIPLPQSGVMDLRDAAWRR